MKIYEVLSSYQLSSPAAIFSASFSSFSFAFALVMLMQRKNTAATIKNAAGAKLITLFMFVSTVALKSVAFATNPTAPSARIPIEPPIAFPSLVEKEIQEAITPSERTPVFSQLSSMISALNVKHVMDTTFVTPYKNQESTTRLVN